MLGTAQSFASPLFLSSPDRFVPGIDTSFQMHEAGREGEKRKLFSLLIFILQKRALLHQKEDERDRGK